MSLNPLTRFPIAGWRAVWFYVYGSLYSRRRNSHGRTLTRRSAIPIDAAQLGTRRALQVLVPEQHEKLLIISLYYQVLVNPKFYLILGIFRRISTSHTKLTAGKETEKRYIDGSARLISRSRSHYVPDYTAFITYLKAFGTPRLTS